ncbi:MAG: hypothetical protein J6S67_01490 [Methanobrevibacter sp.]|nr:hypothetical protein [Methanobrevibacter sp.]
MIRILDNRYNDKDKVVLAEALVVAFKYIEKIESNHEFSRIKHDLINAHTFLMREYTCEIPNIEVVENSVEKLKTQINAQE